MVIDAEVIVVGLGVGGKFRCRTPRRGEPGCGGHRVGSGRRGCAYWGCVPSKMIIRAANTLAEARRASKLAGNATVQPDWPVVTRRIREEVTDGWDDTLAVERFTGKGGRFIRGRAAVTGNRTVVIGGQEIRTTRGLVPPPGPSRRFPQSTGWPAPLLDQS